MLKLHTNTGGLVWCILTLACISCISLLGPHCVSRCTAKSDKGTLQLSVCCISRCGIEMPVWVKVLQSIPCCHQAKHSSLQTASPSAWLTAFCQPSSLMSTSVSTILISQSHVFKFSSSLYFCLTPPSPSWPPLWWYMLLSPWNTGSEPYKPSLLMATSSVLGTLLHKPSTSVYRPIGALVCKPHKCQVSQLRNMAPHFICDHCTCCTEWEVEPNGMQCQRNSSSVTETTPGGVSFIFSVLQHGR